MRSFVSCSSRMICETEVWLEVDDHVRRCGEVMTSRMPECGRGGTTVGVLDNELRVIHAFEVWIISGELAAGDLVPAGGVAA